jgi:hypothetical protein
MLCDLYDFLKFTSFTRFLAPSRPRAVSRPRPLSEPYVTVSRQTAQALRMASVDRGRPGNPVSPAWSDHTTDLERMQSRPTACGSSAEVFVLIPVVGVSHPLDLHVPDDFHASGSLKVYDPPWSRFPFDVCEELPQGGGCLSEVVPPGPPLALGRVPSSRPSPELPEEAGIDPGKGGRGTDVPVIVRPAPDHGIELADHHCRLLASVGSDDLLGLGDDRLHCGLGGQSGGSRRSAAGSAARPRRGGAHG